MKLRIKTQAASDGLLRQMAQEAALTPEQIAEIAVYNLIAVWADARRTEHPEIPVALDPAAHDGGVRTGLVDRL